MEGSDPCLYSFCHHQAVALWGNGLTVLIRPGVYLDKFMSIRIEPSDYLNLDSLEMHGPSSIRMKDEAESAPTPSSPKTIDEVAAALRQAQLRGDHGQIGVLSVQLDDMLAGTSSAPTEAPEDPCGLRR